MLLFLSFQRCVGGTRGLRRLRLELVDEVFVDEEAEDEGDEGGSLKRSPEDGVVDGGEVGVVAPINEVVLGRETDLRFKGRRRRKFDGDLILCCRDGGDLWDEGSPGGIDVSLKGVETGGGLTGGMGSLRLDGVDGFINFPPELGQRSQRRADLLRERIETLAQGDSERLGRLGLEDQ